MSKETREYAKQLVSQMTLEEKMSQMVYQSPAIERLGIPAYNWWNEALHGVARAGVATVFPQAIGLAATFDKELLQEIGDVVSTEGRAKFSNIDLLDKYHYIGIKHLWSKHSILDQELLYEHFPKEILPYDYETYAKNPARFEMVTTNCHTGRACYLEEKYDRKRIIDIAKASSSLPYVCPVAYVDGIPMLDGGIIDSIPVMRAFEQGYEKNVVVLTRNRGYRKKGRDIKIPHFIYKKYPRLRVVLSKRCRVYNEQLELVEKLEDEGRIIVIRPHRPMEVDRIETDIKKLTDLYDEGYACAKKIFEEKHLLEK